MSGARGGNTGRLLDVRPAEVSRGRMIAAVVGAPLAWTLHLMASYIIVAVWCASDWDGLAVAVGLVTLVCAAISIVCGVIAWRVWREGQAMLERDAEPGRPDGWDSRMGERGARVAFLAVMSLAGAALFTFLIILQGLPPLFTPPCWAGIPG